MHVYLIYLCHPLIKIPTNMVRNYMFCCLRSNLWDEHTQILRYSLNVKLDITSVDLGNKHFVIFTNQCHRELDREFSLFYHPNVDLKTKGCLKCVEPNKTCDMQIQNCNDTQQPDGWWLVLVESWTSNGFQLKLPAISLLIAHRQWTVKIIVSVFGPNLRKVSNFSFTILSVTIGCWVGVQGFI